MPHSTAHTSANPCNVGHENLLRARHAAFDCPHGEVQRASGVGRGEEGGDVPSGVVAPEKGLGVEGKIVHVQGERDVGWWWVGVQCEQQGLCVEDKIVDRGSG